MKVFVLFFTENEIPSMSSVKTDAMSYPPGIERLPNYLSSASGTCRGGNGEDTAGGVA